MALGPNTVFQVPPGLLPPPSPPETWAWNHPAGSIVVTSHDLNGFDHFSSYSGSVGLLPAADPDKQATDYILVPLKGGDSYEVYVAEVAGAKQIAGEPRARVLDDDGDVVSNGYSIVHNAGGSVQTLSAFVAPETGTYRIEIALSPDGGPDQSYQVQVAQVLSYPARPGGDSVFGAGDDTFTGGDAGERVDGGAGNDTILGMGGNDSLLGGAGDDNLNGNLGADTVAGGAGADFVRGGQGADLVFGDDGDDWHVNGNLGDDVVHGGAGDDMVFGGAGEDTITGDAGDDTISGDLGQDLLAGGAGADRFHFGHGSGIDTVQDFDPDGGDVIHLVADINGSGIASFADILAHAVVTPDGVVIDLGADNSVTLQGVAKGALSAGDFAFG
ncbi:MAG: calcium-binding protein [Alphaproteobacteria bacterium]